MRTSVKWNLVLLALVVGVACATGAYAQEFSWSLSSLPGVGVSGSGTGEATNEGGTYLVTAFTGSISIPGSSGAAISFVSCTSGSTCIDPTGQYQYDDLLFPSNTPELDEYGLVFSATGLADMNLCGTYGCANLNGYDNPYYVLDVLNTDQYYAVSFSTSAVPEPSALVLLSVGLAALTLALGWGRSRAS